MGGNSEGTKKKKVLPGTKIGAGDIKLNKIQYLPSRERNNWTNHFSWCDKYWNRDVPRMHSGVQDMRITSNWRRGGYRPVMEEFLGKRTDKMCVSKGSS